MTTTAFYPVGTAGIPWGDAERELWLARQRKQRSYADDVLSVVEHLRTRFDVFEYGRIEVGLEVYPQVALRSRNWREDLPSVLVTGGVHGYETSGVHGALQFLDKNAERWDDQVNLLVVPCVSPWAYERVQRWNAQAIDPNRSFRADSPVAESAALMRLIAPVKDRILLHVDLHETTDTDASEFEPARAARDGKTSERETVPDGFYLCGDSENPQLDFQQAVNTAVAKVTHIAPADEHGEIIGSKVVAPGVILYAYKQLGLCAGMTNARYTTTTEVYPDSPRATPEQCNAAQVAAVEAAIGFALSHA